MQIFIETAMFASLFTNSIKTRLCMHVCIWLALLLALLNYLTIKKWINKHTYIIGTVMYEAEFQFSVWYSDA